MSRRSKTTEPAAPPAVAGADTTLMTGDADHAPGLGDTLPTAPADAPQQTQAETDAAVQQGVADDAGKATQELPERELTDAESKAALEAAVGSLQQPPTKPALSTALRFICGQGREPEPEGLDADQLRVDLLALADRLEGEERGGLDHEAHLRSGEDPAMILRRVIFAASNLTELEQAQIARIVELLDLDPCLANLARKPLGHQEPIFVLRAQDAVAEKTIRFWAELARKARATAEKIEGALVIADRFSAWPLKKAPGRPAAG